MDTEYIRKTTLDFLREVSVMSVAINGQNGPSSSVLLFAVDDDFTFYFVTHKDSYKAKALLFDPRISMSIWAFDRMLVQCDGVATEIRDIDEIDRTIDKLVDSVRRLKEFWPPVLRIQGEGYVVYKIKSTWVRALDLSTKTIVAGETPFTEIIKKQ